MIDRMKSILVGIHTYSIIILLIHNKLCLVDEVMGKNLIIVSANTMESNMIDRIKFILVGIHMFSMIILLIPQ